MRRIYRKIKLTVMICCFFGILLLVGCRERRTDSDKATEEVYRLGRQEIQIDLSEDYRCTEQNEEKVVLNGKNGEVRIEYLPGEGIHSEYFPRTEQECAFLYEEVIGVDNYQIEDFHAYENEGLYYTTIRYDLDGDVGYLIGAGNFGSDDGYRISALLNTGNREEAKKIQNAVYNVKVFTE